MTKPKYKSVKVLDSVYEEIMGTEEKDGIKDRYSREEGRVLTFSEKKD